MGGARSLAALGIAALDISPANDETPRKKVYALFIHKRHCKAFADVDCVRSMQQHRSYLQPKLDAARGGVVRTVRRPTHTTAHASRGHGITQLQFNVLKP